MSKYEEATTTSHVLTLSRRFKKRRQCVFVCAVSKRGWVTNSVARLD